MSLTSFLESSPAVRGRLLSEFTKPEFRLKVEIKAPPLTASYGLTGTAFDYLLRFYVQKLNPSARTRHWTAEGGLALLSLHGRTHRTFVKARRMFAEVQARYKEFLASDLLQPTRRLAEGSVRLAYLENVFRVGIVDEN